MKMDVASVFERDRTIINRELDRALKFNREVPSRLARAMRYAALGPGKRIRPVLCIEAFRAAGGRQVRDVLPFCAGIEMIHAFSLAHDDLPSMDDDDFRRGRPSLHRKFDEATAILAADGLFACAFEQFALSPAPDSRRLAAITAICRAVGPAGMTGGQMLDICSDAAGRGAGSLERMQEKKTAEFLAAALVTGAIIGGAGTGELRRLRAAGLHLGALFQITDDLIDAEQASDERLATMVSRHGYDGALGRAAREAESARKLLASLGPGYRLLAGFPELLLHRES